MSTVTLPPQSSRNRNRAYRPAPPRNQALNYREVGTYHKPLVATTKMYRISFSFTFLENVILFYGRRFNIKF